MKTTDNAVVKKAKRNETKQKQEKETPCKEVPLLLHFSWSASIEDTGHELVSHNVRR